MESMLNPKEKQTLVWIALSKYSKFVFGLLK